MSTAQDLKGRSPFSVEISDYIDRMRAGTIPRPEQLGVDSWVDAPGSRTFGFGTKEAAETFRKKYVR